MNKGDWDAMQCFPEGPSTQYLRSFFGPEYYQGYGFWNQKPQILGTWTLWGMFVNTMTCRYLGWKEPGPDVWPLSLMALQQFPLIRGSRNLTVCKLGTEIQNTCGRGSRYNLIDKLGTQTHDTCGL